MSDKELEYFSECYVVRATLDAILVEFEDGREEWVPLSLVNEDSEVWEEEDEGELIIPSWFAKQKRLV